MNERTENILEQDLLPEQAEWLLQSFKELSFDSAVNGDAYVNSFWSTAQVYVRLSISIKLLDCIAMSREFHIGVTVAMHYI